MDSLTNGMPAAQVKDAMDIAAPPINRLTDEELAKIFSHLEPLERLNTADVCRKWARASGLLWTDIKTLDLASIPKAKMGSIVHLCPNLKSMVATMQIVPLNDLNASMHRSLRRVALFQVNLSIGETSKDLVGPSLLTHFQRMPDLEELVWHSVFATSVDGCKVTFVRSFIPPINECGSLTKLHLTGGMRLHALQLFDSLSRMPNLRCLTLGDGLYIREPFAEIMNGFRQALRAMPALRELCLINIRLYEAAGNTDLSANDDFGFAVLRDFFDILQQLEVFVLVESPTFGFFPILRVLPTWIALHSSLRLLVVDVNSCWQFDDDANVALLVPPRRRYPKGFGSDPLPYLNVFLGGGVTSHLTFSQSTNAKIWPISEPLPEFLEKPDIAEITGGVWALDVIKDATKRAIPFWLYMKATHETVHFVD